MSELYLYVYDLSKGMAKQFSAMFLGKHFDGVWHTGIVAYDKEWYFGNDGISCCLPKATILGEPNEIIHLGKTEVAENDFFDIINQMRETTYKIGTYNLLEHNCNNFSNDLSMFLIGKPIPQHIIDLPREVLSSPLGAMLRPLLEQAADPLHQYKNGDSSFLPQIPNAGVQHTKSEKDVQISPSLTLFNPDVNSDLNDLLNHCIEKSLLNQNEVDLFMDIQSFIQDQESKSTILNNHLKLLFDVYFNLVKNDQFKIMALKILQNLSLNEKLATMISKECSFVSVFVPHLEDSKSNELTNLSLQLMSNLCSHKAVSEHLLHEEHQDTLFKHVISFTHIKLETQIEIQIFESAISLFYNLVAHYHLENLVNDSNALSLGCMLLERFHQIKTNPKTIYHLLSLLRSCLANSDNVRELALSMELDLSKVTKELTSKGENNTNEQNNEIQSVLTSIDQI
ncbi:desumoylating isopeptidase 1-like, partial [Brachionus plicatilis]